METEQKSVGLRLEVVVTQDLERGAWSDEDLRHRVKASGSGKPAFAGAKMRYQEPLPREQDVFS
jgi:hypothetical protein